MQTEKRLAVDGKKSELNRGQPVASYWIVGRPPRLSKAIVGRREHKVSTQSVLS
jgi:hypothetical protein